MSGDSLVSGIFIKNIIVGSAADKCGSLRVGDRILGKIDFLTLGMVNKISFYHLSYDAIETKKYVAISAVDGVDIRHSSHELAVKTIKSAGDRMTLCVQSLNTEVSHLISFLCELDRHKFVFNLIRVQQKIQ